MNIFRKFDKFDEYFNLTGPISKAGVILGGIGILLMAISFIVGVQVLIFIPAFALSMLIYSYIEVYHVKKNIQLFWQVHNDQIELKIVSQTKYVSSFFKIAVYDNPARFVDPIENMKWELEENKKYFLIIQGTLHLFRKHIQLPEPPVIKKQKTGNNNSQLPDEYFQVRLYQEGDDISRIDTLKTSLSEHVFIRSRIQETLVESSENNSSSAAFSVKGNISLHEKKDTYKGRHIEWIMIMTGLLASYLEWGNILFTITALFIGIIAYKRQKENKPYFSKKTMNIAVIIIFALFIYEAALHNSTIQAGIHFLILFSVIKQLFQRERRDGITYMFLTLFVFVAISMFNLNVWFIIFFTLFLLEAIALFTYYSSGENQKESKKSFGRTKQRKHFIFMNIIIVTMTLLLFFILPHGTKNNNSIVNSPSKSYKTGFNDEVKLTDIQSLKQDFTKQFVIQNGDENKQDFYKSLYWRGMRFTTFEIDTWKNELKYTVPYMSTYNNNIPTETLEVKYYMNGTSHLFIPKAPVALTGNNFMNAYNDRSIIEFQNEQYSTQDIDIKIAKTENTYEDFNLEPFRFPIVIDTKTENIFKNFWNEIPENIIDNPQLISDYISNQAGFSYSIENPAQNVEDFLYGSKQGHCEYFATTLAVTLQHFGFPATIVNGFHGGEWNDIANAWILRGLDAHSWVEAFHPQQGWLTYDPTPPNLDPIPWFQNNIFLKKSIEYYDVIELAWFNNIVQFDTKKQQNTFQFIKDNSIFFLFTILIAILSYKRKFFYKKYLFHHIHHNEKEKFMYWFSKKTNNPHFSLQQFEESHPSLVKKTRHIIYGTNTSSINNLKKAWRKIFKSLS